MDPKEAFHVECLRHGADGNELKFGGRRSRPLAPKPASFGGAGYGL